MSILRRINVLILRCAALAIVAVLTPVPWVPAGAQQTPQVRLTLVAQTPFTTTGRSTLDITVRAEHLAGRPVRDLTTNLGIGSAIRSREVYEQALVEGPSEGLLVDVTDPERGVLREGESREFTMRVNLAGPEGSTAITGSTDSLVYPGRFELRSDGVPVAELNTAVIHAVQNREERRLLFNWQAQLTGPIAFDPEWRLTDARLEEAVRPGGALHAAAQALAEVRRSLPDNAPTFDLVVEPSLLVQLERMADGYERADGSEVEAGNGAAVAAAEVLRQLRRTATEGSAQLDTLAFSSPSLPALLGSGLTAEVGRQRAVGRSTVRRILGRWPAADVERPGGGLLDQAALDSLAGSGVEAILGDEHTVERPEQANGFAPPPTARLHSPEGTRLGVVLPDPSIGGLLRDPGLVEDPVRAAQAVLGELMAIWREQPSPAPPTVRGVAMVLDGSLPAELWAPLVERISEASWLRPVIARDLVNKIRPAGRKHDLLSPSAVTFSAEYAEAIGDQRRRIEAYGSMTTDPDPPADSLAEAILFAEAGVFVGNETAGRIWYDHVNNVTGRIFDLVRPSTDQEFTLTSTGGQVPLLMGDPGEDAPLEVVVQLVSSKFDFPRGDEQVVVLTRPGQVVTFEVEAKASGQQPITVVTRAPSGRVIDEQTLVVRTWAANRIALSITILAAAGLIALWGRRWFRRRRT